MTIINDIVLYLSKILRFFFPRSSFCSIFSELVRLRYLEQVINIRSMEFGRQLL